MLLKASEVKDEIDQPRVAESGVRVMLHHVKAKIVCAAKSPNHNGQEHNRPERKHRPKQQGGSENSQCHKQSAFDL